MDIRLKRYALAVAGASLLVLQGGGGGGGGRAFVSSAVMDGLHLRANEMSGGEYATFYAMSPLAPGSGPIPPVPAPPRRGFFLRL